MNGIEGYGLLALAWACWCGLHSLLIAPPITGWFEKRLGPGVRYFRIGYNLVALLTLAGPVVVMGWLRAGEAPLFVWEGWAALLRYALLGVSVLLFVGGARQYDLGCFAGITQLRSGRTTVLLNESAEFVTSGVSGITRHPWYLGGLIFVWASSRTMYPSTVLSAALISVYFVIGTLLEERKLGANYGEPYRKYQHQVSMLLPIKWLIGVFGHSDRRGESHGK